MKLIKSPQRSDSTVSYSADGDTLTVSVDGIEDIFDFTEAGDGTFTDFHSSVLPFCPLVSAAKDSGGLTVKVINTYGPQPVQQPDEADEDFAARMADWDKQRTEYEVEI